MTLKAGSFATWLQEIHLALRTNRGTSVPCGDCRGCCVSSYHIPLREQDGPAKARVPPQWIVHAPGSVMMGYRGNGLCPMLQDGSCSIYEDRPQSCRDYDCRIFAAAGIAAGGHDKRVINDQVRRWEFTYASEEELRLHESVRAAASFIRTKGASFPGGRGPTAPTGIAVLALKSHGVFLSNEVRDDLETARAIIEASRAFDRPKTWRHDI
jgi:Fe-S-cluster containining protein